MFTVLHEIPELHEAVDRWNQICETGLDGLQVEALDHKVTNRNSRNSKPTRLCHPWKAYEKPFTIFHPEKRSCGTVTLRIAADCRRVITLGHLTCWLMLTWLIKKKVKPFDLEIPQSESRYLLVASPFPHSKQLALLFWFATNARNSESKLQGNRHSETSDVVNILKHMSISVTSPPLLGRAWNSLTGISSKFKYQNFLGVLTENALGRKSNALLPRFRAPTRSGMVSNFRVKMLKINGIAP